MGVSDIHDVTVLGAGNMGHGIAEIAALAGYDVVLRDVKRELVDEGYEELSWSVRKLAENGAIDEDADEVLDRVDTRVDLASAVEDADLVVEAAPERLSLKRDIFGELDQLAPEEAILATNTSSLSITDIASATDRPDRVVGMHFFNPPVKMDLVEVIYGEETADESAECAKEFVESLGKTPIYVRKDVPGFVVNSVLKPFMIEPAWMVSEGETTIPEADATMVHEREYPMGPFELTDLTGLDVIQHVLEEGESPVPPIMAEKVEAGEHGRKTGAGYYEYDGGDGPTYEREDASTDPEDGFDWLRVESLMINEAAKLIGNDVATAEEIDTGMRLGTGFPTGICERADALGLDRVLETLETLAAERDGDRYDPAGYLQELVEAGNVGERSGRGFHRYDRDDDFENITYTLTDRGVLEIVLDRPQQMNAISEALSEEIVTLLDGIDESDVRCIVIEGAGDRAFSAGADITGFGELTPSTVDEMVPVAESLQAFPRPTVAKIDGFCLGGGFELALGCDIRIASTESQFGFPEITLGLIPGGGGTQRTLRMIGEARTKELVFRGEPISAERAESWGLVNRAVPRDDLEETVDAFVEDFVSGPPTGLKVAKRVINDGADASLDAALGMERQGFGVLLSTQDVDEGVEAFMEDREPEFQGE